MAILVEIQPEQGRAFLAADVFAGDDAVTAWWEAKRRYPNACSRKIRLIDEEVIEELVSRGLDICLGSPECCHGSVHPHLMGW